MITTDPDIIKQDYFSLIRLNKFEEDDFHKKFESNITKNNIKLKKRIGLINVKENNKRIYEFNENIEDYHNLSPYMNKISNYICPICLDLLIFPIITNCGHTYCRVCIYEYTLNKDVNNCNCLKCPQKIKQNKYISNSLIKKIIEEKVLKNLKNVNQVKYMKRLKKHKQYLNKRRVIFNTSVSAKKVPHQNIKAAVLEIDLRTEDFKWKRGVVKEIKLMKNLKIANVLIYEENISKLSLERFVNLESDSVAKLGFYTDRE